MLTLDRRTLLAGLGCSLLPVSESRAADPLRVQLSWLKSVESAPYFAALENGYFAAQSLAVELIGGGPQIDPMAQVASGAVDVAIVSSALQVLTARARGVPAVVLGCQFQQAPLGLAARRDRNLQLPAGLKGAKIGYQQVNRTLLNGILKANGLSFEDVTTTVVTADPTAVMQGRIDLMTVSVLNVPFTMEEQGVAAQSWTSSDLGMPMQGAAIVCLRETLTRKRDVLQRYMRAVGQGMAFNLANPDKVTDAVVTKYSEGLNPAQQSRQNRAQLAFMTSAATKAHGVFWIDEDVWAKTGTILRDIGMIEKPVDLPGMLATDFLQSVDMPKA